MTNPNDDPRLTAYALGELDGDERREVERLLAESPAARAAVDEIRGMAVEITAHLRTEPMPALTSLQRSALMSGPNPNRHVTSQGFSEIPGMSRATTRNGNAAVIAAACVMLLVAGWVMVASERKVSRESADGKRSVAALDSSSLDGQPIPKEWIASRNAWTEHLPADPNSIHRRSEVRTQPTNGTSNSITFSKPFQSGGNGRFVQSGKGGRFHIVDGSKSMSHSVRNPQPASVGQQLHTINTPEPGNRFGGRGGVAWGYPIAGTPVGTPGPPHLPLFGAITDKTPGTKQNQWTNGLLDVGGRSLRRFKDAGIHGYIGMDGDLGDGLLRSGRGMPHEFDDGKKLMQLEKLAGKSGDPKSGKTPKPSSVPAGKTTAKGPAVEWFAAKDVKLVRENIVRQFDDLAKQHPKRELAILRVKKRLNDRLQGIERQVALGEQAGQRIAAVEGRVILGEAVRAEVRTLDVDGDGRADFGREGFDAIVENAFLTPLANPLSTFSIDVDTASYSNTRRYLDAGALPPRNAVRVEEFVNYFRYDYPQPTSKDPFSVTLEAGVCPWNVKHRLVLIGLKGREIPNDKRPPANLVFLIDVSGSMSSANRLPLVKLGLEMLVDQLRGKDRVSIVTYSDQARTVLEPTAGDKRDELLRAIHSLHAAGSTNGAAGIQMAYAQAQKAFTKTGSNRVILCTDGDFNVGVKSDDQLVTLIQEKAKSKVFLSVFGFGMGNTKHAKLEKIANKGNGHYAYIDKFQEAKKVFVEEMSGTLYTIAKDVKIQVEFNPAKVASYRLIGYENRLLAAQDFNNDKKDAGEIGAGHTVTALYEIVPVDAKNAKPAVDDLKYQRRVVADKAKPVTQELLTVKLRYKQPTGDKSTKIEFALKDAAVKKAPTENFDFASAVAMYGLLLRDSKHAGDASLDLVRELALGAIGKDPEGHRSEFLKLVHKTETYAARQLGKAVPAARPFKPAGK